MAYILKAKIIDVVNEAGDSTVVLTCHLTDDFGVPFTTASDTIDSFIVRAPASSLPGSGFLAYLTALATDEIEKKYGFTYLGEGSEGSDVLAFSEVNTATLFTDLLVDGPGLSAPVSVNSIISPTEILLSSTLTLDYTADATAPSFSRLGNVTSGSNVISGISITNIVGNMSITGTGILAGAVVLAISGPTEILISQNAITTGTPSLTFSPEEESNFLDSVSPAILTRSYEGLTITGPSLQNDTTIDEVISGSRLRLSLPATGDVTGGTYTVSGAPSYVFDTSALTIDFIDLQRVVDTINFLNL
jgi:hypothetical protein